MVYHTKTWTVPVQALGFAALLSLAFIAAEAIADSPIQRLFAASDQKLARSAHEHRLQSGENNARSLKVYLFPGDIVNSFDVDKYRPDAAIMPTNVDLDLKSQFPVTQRALVSRVKDESAAWAIFQANAKNAGRIRMATQPVIVDLKPLASAKGKFPRWVCLLATDFPTGGSGDDRYRDLFAQKQIKIGVFECLLRLDAIGAKSVVMPLLGAASTFTASENLGERRKLELLRCRLVNSIAGISLGINDFASKSKSVDEIGVIQYEKDIRRLFPQSSTDKGAEAAYINYAAGVNETLRRGLAGNATTQAELPNERDCNQILGFADQPSAARR